MLLKRSVGYKWVLALDIFMQIPCQELKYHLHSQGEVNLEQVWKKKGSVDAWFVAAKVFAEAVTQKFCFVLKKPV